VSGAAIMAAVFAWLALNVAGVAVAVRWSRRKRDASFGAERGELLGVELHAGGVHRVGIGGVDQFDKVKAVFVRLADAFDEVRGAIARRQALALGRCFHGAQRTSAPPDCLAFAIAAHLREVNPVKVNPESPYALPFMRWRVRRWKAWGGPLSTISRGAFV
jgi:hypothetical protein